MQVDLLVFWDRPWARWRSRRHFNEMARFRTGAMDVVRERLTALLLHAGRTVPFYRDRIDPALARSDPFEALGTLPVVRRWDLMGERAGDRTSREPLGKLRPMTTSGTTGEPLTVLTDRGYEDWNTAALLLFRSWAGWRPGDSVLKIWGSLRDILGDSETVRTRMSELLGRSMTINALRMAPGEIPGFVERIDGFRPRLVECYASGGYFFAREVLRQGLELRWRPRGVTATADTLLPAMERAMEEVFGVAVTNRYSAREAGRMAATCPEGGRLHVNPFTHYLETVDDGGNPVTGRPGRIVVTVLTNRAMPLIRYDIGDWGTLDEGSTCPCGRDWQTLSSVDGKAVTSFLRRDGTVVHSYALLIMIGHGHGQGVYDVYQAIQEDYGRFLILAVLSGQASPLDGRVRRAEENIGRDIRRIFGADTEVLFRYVDYIPPTASGKYVSEVCLVPRRNGEGREGVTPWAAS